METGVVHQYRVDVPLYVVDCEQRQPRSKRESLGIIHTHQQASDKARAGGDGDGCKAVDSDAGTG